MLFAILRSLTLSESGVLHTFVAPGGILLDLSTSINSILKIKSIVSRGESFEKFQRSHKKFGSKNAIHCAFFEKVNYKTNSLIKVLRHLTENCF